MTTENIDYVRRFNVQTVRNGASHTARIGFGEQINFEVTGSGFGTDTDNFIRALALLEELLLRASDLPMLHRNADWWADENKRVLRPEHIVQEAREQLALMGRWACGGLQPRKSALEPPYRLAVRPV